MTSLREYRSAYLAATLDLLWHQWSSLGVLGQAKGEDHWVVDPEALIVGTIRFGRYDPRLLDAAIDWCMLNGKWISIARLQRLQKGFPPTDRRVLSAIAATLAEEDRSTKWRGLSGEGKEDGILRNPESLFILPDGQPLPQGASTGPRDSAFLRYGFLRPPLEKRKISARVPVGKPAALRVKLRALFGVTSRADIVLFLLTHDRAHPRLVARQIHYAQPPVARAMAEMALSGLISERRTGRELEYELDRAGWWRFLKLPKKPAWANWAAVFQALREIWECTQALQDRRLESSVLGPELRRCLWNVQSLLYESEIGFVFSDTAGGDPETSFSVCMKETTRLFEKLRVNFNAASSSAV